MNPLISKKNIYMKNFGKLSESFIEVIEKEFPDDIEVRFAKNAILTLKKTNPRLLMNYWLTYIYMPNKEQIDVYDYSFIMNIDKFDNILEGFAQGEQIKNALNRLQSPVMNMSEENKKLWMTFVNNMSKLSVLYFS